MRAIPRPMPARRLLKPPQVVVYLRPLSELLKTVPLNAHSVRERTDISNLSSKRQQNTTSATASSPIFAKRTSTFAIMSSVFKMKLIVSTPNWVALPCLLPHLLPSSEMLSQIKMNRQLCLFHSLRIIHSNSMLKPQPQPQPQSTHKTINRGSPGLLLRSRLTMRSVCQPEMSKQWGMGNRKKQPHSPKSQAEDVKERQRLIPNPRSIPGARCT